MKVALLLAFAQWGIGSANNWECQLVHPLQQHNKVWQVMFLRHFHLFYKVNIKLNLTAESIFFPPKGQWAQCSS